MKTIRMGQGRNLCWKRMWFTLLTPGRGLVDLDNVQILSMSARFRRIVVGSPVASLALYFQERLSPVSPVRLVDIPEQLPAGSVNPSQDGVMQSETNQTMGRTTT